jgi:hypothetical protein
VSHRITSWCSIESHVALLNVDEEDAFFCFIDGRVFAYA